MTGSCFLLSTGAQKVLIDCGMFKGSKTEKQLNYDPFPFDAAEIDCTLLTYAHIDHAGLLPKLTHAGFQGPIYATAPSVDLCSVMLPDSASIQEMEVENLNHRNRRRGRAEITSIYTGPDVDKCLGQFRSVEYETWIDVADGGRARFWNAGHLLGSASIEIEVTVPGANRRARPCCSPATLAPISSCCTPIRTPLPVLIM